MPKFHTGIVMIMPNRLCRVFVVLIGGLFLGGLAESFAQTGGDKAAKKAGAEEKTYTFEMRDKQWSGVFEWLTDKTGRIFISSIRPTGTFNFIGKKDDKYTIPQIIDIINDGLLAQKYTLLNRGTSFTIVAADEKIDPALLARVDIDDLGKHGKTEIVSTVYQCKALVAEDSGPEVKKQMGPFGEVVILHQANQLILTDTVANLLRVKQQLDLQEGNEATGQADTFAHKCIYIRARDAEATLRNFLGEQKTITEVIKAPTATTAGGTGSTAGGTGSTAMSALDQFGGSFGSGGGGGGKKGGGGGGMGGMRADSQTRIRSYTVTSDDRTNMVFVNGPPNKISQAKTIMAKLDVGTVPFVAGVPIMQRYTIKEGNAPEVTKALLEMHKGSTSIRIAPINSTTVMVLAPPEDQILIAAQINDTRPPASKTGLIMLTLLDAGRTVDTLKNLFPDSKNGAPYLEADTSRNAVIIKGTDEQVAEVKAAIGAIGENPTIQGGNLRIISLDKGGAATLADAIQRMLKEIRPNSDVRVIVPGSDSSPKKELKQEAPKVDPLPKAKARLGNREFDFVYQLAEEPQAQKNTPAKTGAPVTITAVGNKLIISSDDPAALGMVTELVRLLTQNTASGDFEIIRLKHANAVDTAKIIDELFNGVKQGAGGGGGGGRGAEHSSRPGGSAKSLRRRRGSPRRAACRTRACRGRSVHQRLARAGQCPRHADHPPVAVQAARCRYGRQ